jgi:alkaline phosphatase
VLYDGMNGTEMQLGQLQANHLGVGFTSGAHTADFVPLLALGPGAERFGGFLQNTDVFQHYLALAGIDFRNPTVPLLAESGPSAADVEDVRVLV